MQFALQNISLSNPFPNIISTLEVLKQLGIVLKLSVRCESCTEISNSLHTTYEVAQDFHRMFLVSNISENFSPPEQGIPGT